MDDVPNHLSRDLVPIPVDRRREFIEALADKARVWVGRAGTVTVSQEGDSVVLSLVPVFDTAAPVWVVATEWIDIQVGTDSNSRWELTYSDDHTASVGDLVRGVIEGGATEFRAFGRSRVRVSTLRGDLWSRRGQESLWGLIPAPGWQRWGKRHTFTPYAAKGAM
ncbi:MAG: hypothetical protein C0444_06395 [Microbacterium sp.]|nr:hypothetical protein [Microbacterium sp.]MBA4345131.1 hypothetical protein [Microbacterium sp.]